MNQVSIVALFIALMVPASGVSQNNLERVVCNGAYWNYQFNFAEANCVSEQKVRKDIPGSHKRGHVSIIPDRTPALCWREIAEIQMDGARCCLDGKYSLESQVDCSKKSLRY